MAINPFAAYPGKTAGTSLAYPYGQARDVTVPGDGTGTPLRQEWVNDLWGFLQAILTDAAASPSGTPDTATASQYLDSLKAIVQGMANDLVITADGSTTARDLSERFADRYHVKDWGAIGDGVADDITSIQAAIDAIVANGGGELVFGSGTYLVSSPLDLSGVAADKGILIRGQGIRSTIIKRSGTNSVLDIIGTANGAAGPTVRDITIQDLEFDGDDNSGTLVNLKASGVVYFDRVTFKKSAGIGLDMLEFYDSRFVNCRFLNLGEGSTSTPVIQMGTDGTYTDPTNNIYFIGCVWETYNGPAIKSIGTNLNEIYFTSCKMESIHTVGVHVDITSASNIDFGTLQITSRGTDNTGATISELVKLTGVNGYDGRFKFEHIGTPATDAATLQRYITIRGAASNGRAHLTLYGVNADNISGNEWVNIADSQPEDHMVTVSKDGWSTTKAICNFDSGFSGQSVNVISGGSKPPQVEVRNLDSNYRFRLRQADNGDIQFFGVDSGVEYEFMKWVASTRTILPAAPFSFSSNWDADNLLRIGGYRFWVDATGDLRSKVSDPSSDTDGTVVGTQT